jgi:hypothetical protein
MGEHWVTVRDAVRAGTLRASDRGAAEVAARFDALLRFTSLSLGRQLGTEVTPVLSRKELAEPSTRTQSLVASLADHSVLVGAIRVPATVGDIVVTADLRAGTVTCHVDVDGPREGRPTTRVNWLLRQLKNAPDGVRIEARVAHARGAGAADLLKNVREDPALLVADPTKEIRSFQIAIVSPMGTKRGRGRGSFIDGVLDAVDGFYADVLQHLKAWSAAPPKLRPDVESIVHEQEGTAPSLVSTAPSSQDEPTPERAQQLGDDRTDAATEDETTSA